MEFAIPVNFDLDSKLEQENLKMNCLTPKDF